MDYDRIKELLEEAMASKSASRRRDILSELKQPLGEKCQRHWGGQNVVLCSTCLMSILDSLYWGYLKHCPQQLMVLLPLFMLLCGNISTTDSMNRLGQINWPYFLGIISDRSN